MYTIYKITNKINGKAYIGQTKRKPTERWGRKGQGYEGQYLGNAIKKYGWDNFSKEILFDDCLTKEEANKVEKDLIKKYKTQETGYNVAPGGNIWEHNNFSLEKRKEWFLQHREFHSKKTSEGMKDWLANSTKEERKQYLGHSWTLERKEEHGQKIRESWKKKTKKEINQIHYNISKSKKDPKAKCQSKEFKQRMKMMALEQFKDGSPLKGSHWYNNGIKNVRAFVCPEGFQIGKI